jgi:DNA-binding transcriptional ArsR family regulator
MAEGRRADSTRRRERVLAALAEATKSGEEITVSSIARRAGVDRTFLYRHRDLLGQLHALDAQLSDAAVPRSSAVSRASLQSDLHAAQQRSVRLTGRVQQLERRLSEQLGEQVWRESGLGAPNDIDQLQQRIRSLEAEVGDVQIQLEERTDELAAARLANRELMTRMNSSRPTG